MQTGDATGRVLTRRGSRVGDWIYVTTTHNTYAVDATTCRRMWPNSVLALRTNLRRAGTL